MDSALVEQLKKTPLPEPAVWHRWLNGVEQHSEAGRYYGMAYPHPQFPEIEVKSRRMLKKMLRVQRYSANTLRKKNQHRLTEALKTILDRNGVHVRDTMREMIADRVAMLAFGDTDLSAMLDQIVRQEVQRALNKDAGRTGRVLEGFIRKIAEDEARRLVLENLTFDMKLTGDVFAPAKGARAVRLGEHEEIEQ